MFVDGMALMEWNGMEWQLARMPFHVKEGPQGTGVSFDVQVTTVISCQLKTATLAMPMQKALKIVHIFPCPVVVWTLRDYGIEDVHELCPLSLSSLPS